MKLMLILCLALLPGMRPGMIAGASAATFHEKCFGIVNGDWQLICQNPCIPGGCNRITVEYDPTPGFPGDEFDLKVCVCQGGAQVCCDVGEPVEGNGATAYGSCNGTTCPAGSCHLVFTEEDIFASCAES